MNPWEEWRNCECAHVCVCVCVCCAAGDWQYRMVFCRVQDFLAGFKLTYTYSHTHTHTHTRTEKQTHVHTHSNTNTCKSAHTKRHSQKNDTLYTQEKKKTLIYQCAPHKKKHTHKMLKGAQSFSIKTHHVQFTLQFTQHILLIWNECLCLHVFVKLLSSSAYDVWVRNTEKCCPTISNSPLLLSLLF